MQIIYGAMPDKELITTKQLEHMKEIDEKREKMSKEAKENYETLQR